MKARLGLAGFARRAGVKPKTLAAYRARKQPKSNPVPEPDGVEEISGQPWWYVATIDAWLSSRPRRRTDSEETR